MIIETITVMQRKNLGNYEHIEISASAKVEEGEEALTALLSLKTFVETALISKVEEVKSDEVEKLNKINETLRKELSKVVNADSQEVAVEKPKKEKKAKKEKPLLAIVDEQEIPPVIPEQKAEKFVAYDSTINEHKSILAGHLTKKYNTAWKTVKPADEIKAFTSSLNGKDFLDSEGKIVESFLTLLHSFFDA